MSDSVNAKSLKLIGKLLKQQREIQGHNLAILAAQCGMTVLELTSIESGNKAQFSVNPIAWITRAQTYALIVQLDIHELSNSVHLVESARDDLHAHDQACTPG